jgi:hypothetical protein
MGLLPLPGLIVAVKVTAPLVASLQMAVPFVESFALLISMSAGSGFDQAGKTLSTQSGTAHPSGAVGASLARNWTWFPGGAAA